MSGAKREQEHGEAAAGLGRGVAPRTNTEVRPRAGRRRFSPAYKRRILEEADRCTEPGQIGMLLRREGL
mgnify:FL=1